MKTHELSDIQKMLHEQGYIDDGSIAMSLFLAMKLEKPVLVEGPAGVGKTEIAKVMAKALQTDVIRLQCYEGLDSTHALYEWNYQHQLLYLKMQEEKGKNLEELEQTIFSDKFLLKRPILQAITHPKKPVLLIDEVDRADEEFESFLLEVLSDWQVTIPEIGTVKATHKPQIILTGNRTRELSEALRRRCLYLWIDYPDFEKELAIVKSKVPEVDNRLGKEICLFMKELRQLRLEKTPGKGTCQHASQTSRQKNRRGYAGGGIKGLARYAPYPRCAFRAVGENRGHFENSIIELNVWCSKFDAI